MRLFLAINLPESIKIALAQELPRFTYLKFRESPPANWHVTLKFIGEAGERELSYVKEKLPPLIARFKPFELCIKNAGFINKRIFAFNVERSPKLFALFRLIDEKLAASGFIKGERYRTFAPHITVGRKNPPVQRDLHAVRHFDLKTRQALAFTVVSVDLMESTLLTWGSVYKRVVSFAFLTVENT